MAISSIYQYLRYSYMYVNISSVASVARKDLVFDILFVSRTAEKVSMSLI